jgi:hypothetical protein
MKLAMVKAATPNGPVERHDPMTGHSLPIGVLGAADRARLHRGVALKSSLSEPSTSSGPAFLQVKRGFAFSAALEPLDVPDGNGFLREAESLDIMDTLDAIRDSARSGAWVELAD